MFVRLKSPKIISQLEKELIRDNKMIFSFYYCFYYFFNFNFCYY